jgi:aspartate-semialdehyde dehydrogenase
MAKSNDDRRRTVAVVGATGAVGEVVLQLLAERDFPVGELRALASGRSAGKKVRYAGREVEVQEARPEAFEGVDFAFFAATGSLSKDLAPEVAKRGGVAIDKSSTWRLDPNVPLVVPEINPDALEKQRGIVANPNCTTTGFVMALAPLHRAAGLRSVVVTTARAPAGGSGEREGTDHFYLPEADREQRAAPLRELPGRWLHDRGSEAPPRNAEDPEPGRGRAGVDDLCARTGPGRTLGHHVGGDGASTLA